ncbi:hypothetical protein QZH41_018903, partial [Actinostola sp. cb2023]
GVSYDVVQRVLDDEVRKSGLHNGPPGFKFIKFPSVFKSKSFKNIKCLNKEGLEIQLSVEFQYRARPKDLRKTILQFEDFDNYVKVLSNLALSSMYDACSRFNTSQFQSQRATFQESVLSTMDKRFKEVSADLTDLQVSNIQRPTSYEKVVRDKESAKENINIALNERPRKLVQAKSTKEDAIKNGQIAVQTAKSNSKILSTKTNAEVQSILSRYDAEARAFSTLKTKQNMTVEGLLSYLSTRVIAERKNTLSVGLDAPAKTKYTY